MELHYKMYLTIPSKDFQELVFLIKKPTRSTNCLSPRPYGLRRRSTAARLPRFWVRIPPGAWMSVRCECCVLSGRGLGDALIMRPEESYRLWCIVVCDLETSRMRRPWSALGRSATRKKCINFSNLFLEWNSTCFGQFLWPSSGVFHCTYSNGICHTGLLTACEQAVSKIIASGWFYYKNLSRCTIIWTSKSLFFYFKYSTYSFLD